MSWIDEALSFEYLGKGQQEPRDSLSICRSVRRTTGEELEGLWKEIRRAIYVTAAKG
jgi:hypothetical protein